jgi:hypothetical protein
MSSGEREVEAAVTNAATFEAYLGEASIVAMSAERDVAQIVPPASLGEYQSFQEKSHFFSQIFIEDEQKLDEAFRLYNARTDLIYRGVNQAKFKLYNSLQRCILPQKDRFAKPYRSVWSELIQCAAGAQEGLLPKYFERQGMQHMTDLAWLSYLQHYGCPTPLLDWTLNFCKALYFALDGADDLSFSDDIACYVSVYAIHDALANLLSPKAELNNVFERIAEQSKFDASLSPPALDKVLGELFGEEMVASAQDMVRKRRRARFFHDRLHRLLDADLLATMPAAFISDRDPYNELVLRVENNLNIVAQDGAFFFNSHPFAPLEWVFEKHIAPSSPAGDHDNCYSLNIHKSLKPAVLARLQDLGYSRAAVYPDSRHICQMVAREVLWRPCTS